MKCKYCKNLDDMEREYPDAIHHGANITCDECGAEYYEEYGGYIWATNKQALINHPKLKKLYEKEGKRIKKELLASKFWRRVLPKKMVKWLEESKPIKTNKGRLK